jgi:hypothetical protein
MKIHLKLFQNLCNGKKMTCYFKIYPEEKAVQKNFAIFIG